jgi:hypothetical protein
MWTPESPHLVVTEKCMTGQFARARNAAARDRASKKLHTDQSSGQRFQDAGQAGLCQADIVWPGGRSTRGQHHIHHAPAEAQGVEAEAEATLLDN